MALCRLPTEMLEKIFSYLDTADVLNVRQVDPRFADIATCRSVIGKVKLFNHYDLTKDVLVDFFGQSPTCNNITSFNISSVYWIPAEDLRKCIENMTSLERLYVMDTNLGLMEADVELYWKLPKLKRLGVTVVRQTLSEKAIQNFPALTHVHFHIHTSLSFLLQYLIDNLCKNDIIEEVSIVEIGFSPAYPALLAMPGSITKLIMSMIHLTYLGSAEIEELARTFTTDISYTQSLYRKVANAQKPLYRRRLSDWRWNFLLESISWCSPFSVEQSEEIYFNDSKINYLMFNEINLIHPLCMCEMYLCVISKLLMYNTMRKLKKIGLNMCVCTAYDDIISVTKLDRFKTPRQRGEIFPWDCILSDVADNSPLIEELELWPCRSSTDTSPVSDSTLECIAKFKKLKRLVIVVFLKEVSGRFLTKVFSECTELKILHIRSHRQNKTFDDIFCEALAYAKLEDLRYERSCSMEIDNLFMALVANNRMKLKRLVISCHLVEIFSVEPVEQFLQANPQLIFLCIIIKDVPETVINIIQETLDKYSNDPKKIYLITERKAAESSVKIPHVHVDQMVKSTCNVSVIDLFNYFDS